MILTILLEPIKWGVMRCDIFLQIINNQSYEFHSLLVGAGSDNDFSVCGASQAAVDVAVGVSHSRLEEAGVSVICSWGVSSQSPMAVGLMGRGVDKFRVSGRRSQGYLR